MRYGRAGKSFGTGGKKMATIEICKNGAMVKTDGDCEIKTPRELLYWIAELFAIPITVTVEDSCKGCKYLDSGSCVIGPDNHCIRRALDYYAELYDAGF
jgi:hypothetical protein